MPLRQSTHIQDEAGLAVAGLRVSVETLAALLTELVAIDIGLQKRCDALEAQLHQTRTLGAHLLAA